MPDRQCRKLRSQLNSKHVFLFFSALQMLELQLVIACVERELHFSHDNYQREKTLKQRRIISVVNNGGSVAFSAIILIHSVLALSEVGWGSLVRMV